jgi:hypothetical protein
MDLPEIFCECWKWVRVRKWFDFSGYPETFYLGRLIIRFNLSKPQTQFLLITSLKKNNKNLCY